MPFVLGFVRLVFVLAVIAGSLPAVLGVFGFAVPQFDLFNHLQLLFFLGALGALALTFLILRRGPLRRIAVGSAAAGLLASGLIVVPEIARAFEPRPELPTDERQVVRMMTHNLFGMNYSMDQVSEAILSENPDIIALQEYFGEQASDLHPRLIAHYPYFVRCLGGKRANLGLYSKLPFTQAEDGQCPENAYGTRRTAHILARFTLADGSEFSVLTSHMDWPFPIERQNAQLEALAAVARSVSGPLILVGDLNSTSWSYALQRFTEAAGLTRETHSLPTYPMKWYYFGAWRPAIPVLPLDHVMVRDGIQVHALRAGQRTASDHLPVVFEFSVTSE